MSMSPKITFDITATGGHLCFLYESPEERLRVLAEYFEEGLAQHDLCILVVPEEVAEITRRFQSIGFDVATPIKEGTLRVFEMKSTYLPHGKFVAEYMLHNVEHFIEDAKKQGYHGLRTAGEMSWINDYPEFIKDAERYEADVNTLTSPDSPFIGVCLYPVQNSRQEVLMSARHTHPSYIYNSEALPNPLYQEALA